MKSCFLRTFPIFSWLHAYQKDDFVGDLISGCTVAIMHIPQGMGYALLGNLPPVVGIYMAFFPVLMYVVFGTSRHNSMGKMTTTKLSNYSQSVRSSSGTFAVVSIMVGKSVNKHSNILAQVSNATDTQHHDQPSAYSPIEVASLICFIVGVIQVRKGEVFLKQFFIASNLINSC